MDLHRVDDRGYAPDTRLSRRAAFRAVAVGAVGLAAIASQRRALAQDATPEASPVASPAAGDVGPALFIQTFTEGTWTPISGDPSGFVLTLTGVADATIAFPDGEPHAVTTVPTEDALTAIGFGPDDAPNAAVAVQSPDGERVIVVELLDPFYDAAGGALIYTAHTVEGEPSDTLSALHQRQSDEEFPESFGPGSLFIDATD